MENLTYQEAVKIGIREGIKYIKEQEYHKTTKRYDRRLRNTRLLLKHYRDLKVHDRLADSSSDKIYEENAIDILDDVEAIDDDEQYVQAISRTKKRTAVIIGHMNRALKYYENICKGEGQLNERRYKIIRYMYIDPTENDAIPTYEEVSGKFSITIKTVGRDVKSAIEDLSILFFGIDGLKL